MTTPDGTIFEIVLDGDPRFGMMAPIRGRSLVDTPALAPLVTTRTRTVTLSDPADPLTLVSLNETITTDARTTSFAYDATTRTGTARTPVGRQSSISFDALGRPSRWELPGAAPVTVLYDATGRPITTTQGSGERRREAVTTYRVDGTVESVRNAIGDVSTLTFDSARRRTSHSLPEGGAVGLAFDASYNVVGVTPPGRGRYEYAFTPTNLQSSMTAPPLAGGGAENAPTTSDFNADRQATGVTLPGGIRIDYGYDAGARLQTLETDAGVYAFSYETTTGELSSVTAPEGGGTVSFARDGVLPTRETWSGTVNGSVGRDFDAGHRVAARTVNGGSAVTFTYDQDSLVESVGGVLTLAVERDGATGNVTRVDQGSLREDLTFDPVFQELVGRSLTLSTSPGDVLYDVQYERDALGRIVQRVETSGGIVTTTNYAYDGNGRLIEAAESGGGANAYDYTYDLAGNRRTGAGGETYLYDEQDRLVSSSHDGGTTYRYSPNGTLASKSAAGGETRYAYDAMSNLRAVELPGGGSVRYLVDGRDRRIQRADGTTTRRWLYDNAGRIVAELDGSDALRAQYVYTLQAHAPDAMVRDGIPYRIVSEPNGSVRLVIDAGSGAIAQRLDYDPFGRVLSDSNPGFQPFGFAGGLYDPATGLVRLGARDYDPETGRWTARDPIGFGGGQTNLYAYAGSDPVNRIDPTGFDAGESAWNDFLSGVGMGSDLFGNCLTPWENLMDSGGFGTGGRLERLPVFSVR